MEEVVSEEDEFDELLKREYKIGCGEGYKEAVRHAENYCNQVYPRSTFHTGQTPTCGGMCSANDLLNHLKRMQDLKS